MKKSQYVGHRYVPKIMGEWDGSLSYEGLSIVQHEGNSFTSKKRVPIGIPLSNEEYWAATGNYNVQIEQYRQDVNQYYQGVQKIEEDFTNYQENTDNKFEEQTKLMEGFWVDVTKYGAIGDGNSHPLSERFTTLEEAQTVYPNAVNLTDEINSISIQYCLNIFDSVYVPIGKYVINKGFKLRFNKKFFGLNKIETQFNTTDEMAGKHIIEYGDEYDYQQMRGFLGMMRFRPNNANAAPRGVKIWSGLHLLEFEAYECLTFLEKGVNRYMDNIKIERCEARYCKGDETNRKYVIDIQGENDNLSIIDLRGGVGNESDLGEYAQIKIAANRGGLLENIIWGGGIKLSLCEGTLLKALHMENEKYGLEIEESQVSIEGIYMFPRTNGENIIIKSSNTFSSLQGSSIVDINNLIIDVLPRHNGNGHENTADISIEGRSTVMIKNGVKMMNHKEFWTDTKTKVGLKIKEIPDMYTKPFDNQYMIDQNKNVLNTFIPSILKPDVNFIRYSNSSPNIDWNLIGDESETYHYRFIQIIDEKRKLALFKSNDQSVTNVTSGERGVLLQITILEAIANHLPFKIYRGKGVNNYDKEIIIPVLAGHNLFDVGDHLMSYPWNNRNIGETDEYTYIDSFMYINNQKNIEFNGSTPPLIGTFIKGDRCVNTNMSIGQSIAWKYTGSEWISEGSY